jgi:hypothetical protein
MSTGISLWLFLIAVAEASPRAADDGFWMLAWRNTLHNVLGALEYVGAAAAFSTLRFTQFWSPLSNLMSFAAGLVLLCLWGMSFPHPFRGLVQRVAETTIFAGVVTMGWCVYRASA